MAFTKSVHGACDAIVFDAVGTLIEPIPAVADVYAEAARRQGVVIDRALVKSRFHQYFRDDERDEARGPLATDEAMEHRRWRRIVGQVLPGLPDPDRAFAELWEHFGRPQAWRCFSDVTTALRFCGERGIAARIASNFDGRLRAVVAGLPELEALQEALFISSEVGFRKPHPALYRAACVSLGLEPGRVLCVGDDPENDVRGAEAAGLRGLLVDRHGKHPDGIARIPDLNALPAFFGSG